jgi:serine/threonine protein kinase
MLTDSGALLRSLVPSAPIRRVQNPAYMSPEQAAQLDIDGRSDLYSIGVLGYYMLSGVLPFDGTTFEALAAKHIADVFVPLATLVPGAPSALVEAIERCLQKGREMRWRTGRDLAEALASVAVRRRWFGGGPKSATAAVFRTKLVAELALFAAAMRAVFKWTMI